MKKLRLLVTTKCDRACPGCCNKQYDLDKLPPLQWPDLPEYESIMLTGGEPMLLNTEVLSLIINMIRVRAPNAPIFMYTAYLKDPQKLHTILQLVDGVTVTLHDPEDGPRFRRLMAHIPESCFRGKSMRLNIFKGVEVPTLPDWDIRENMVWIEDCPLPEDEVFLRLT